MVLFGLDTGLLSEDLRNALGKNSAVRLYRIKRRAECIIDDPATSFVSSGVTRLSSVLVSATRSMLRSVATRTAEAPWASPQRRNDQCGHALKTLVAYKRNELVTFSM